MGLGQGMDHLNLKCGEAQKINQRHRYEANANGAVHAFANDGIRNFFSGAGAFAGFGFGLNSSLIFYAVNLVFQRIFHHVQPR